MVRVILFITFFLHCASAVSNNENIKGTLTHLFYVCKKRVPKVVWEFYEL